MKGAMTLQTSRHNINAQKFSELLLQGRFIFTVQSISTNTRYTFKVKEASGGYHSKGYYVYVLSGRDNNSNYYYLGFIFKDTGVFRVRKSFQNTEHNTLFQSKALPESILGFGWLYKHIHHTELIDQKVILWHEGRCARCGRRLTDPLSIERGLGAECYSLTH